MDSPLLGIILERKPNNDYVCSQHARARCCFLVLGIGCRYLQSLQVSGRVYYRRNRTSVTCEGGIAVQDSLSTFLPEWTPSLVLDKMST